MFQSFIYDGEIKLDFIPNLVFFFFDGDNEKEVKNLYQKLLDINPNMEIIGINGIKGNISNHIPYLIKDKQISVFAFEIDKNIFFIRKYKLNNENFNQNFYKDFTFYKNSASIIFFPFKYDINDFLGTMQKDDMHNIYGGVYSDKNNACFYNGKFFNDELVSVFFHQDFIKFFSISVHGWKPIGLEFKVTKADKNIVYEIENQPALEVIENYMGEIKQENIDNFLHPFCVYNENYKSLASIKSIDREKGSISFFKYVKVGEKVKITIPSTQKSVMKEIEDKLQNIECDGLFMFSCIGRYAYYGDLIEFEIQKVYETLHKPFAGFLTFGEIGSSEANTHSILQNQTMTLVFFKVLK